MKASRLTVQRLLNRLPSPARAQLQDIGHAAAMLARGRHTPQPHTADLAERLDRLDHWLDAATPITSPKTTPKGHTPMTPNSSDPTLLRALDRIETLLGAPSGVIPAAELNAMSVDQLVALQETDPGLYERSVRATAAAPGPTPAYAEAPDDVIPAEQFSALSAGQLADIAEQRPELYEASVQHWANHPTTEEGGA